MHEVLCLTRETGLGGCESRRYETAVAAMVAYHRIGAPLGNLQGVKRIVMALGQCRLPWCRCVTGEPYCKWLNAM